MDVQLVIALNVMVVAAVACLYALHFRPAGYAGWSFVNALVIVVGSLALQYAPARAGWITLVMFVPLVVMPLLLGQLAMRADQRGNPVLARRLTDIATALHPSREFRFNADLAIALRGATTDAVVDALERIERNATPAQQAIIRAFVATERNDWPGVLAAAREAGAPRYDLKPIEIRALGELGRLDEMMSVYQSSKTRLLGTNLQTAQLFLFAFLGRLAAVDRLLNGALAVLPMEARMYWRAIAVRAKSPDDSTARRVLETLATGPYRTRTRLNARRQLQTAPPPAPSVASFKELDIIESRQRREASRRNRPWRALPVTIALLIANTAVLLWAEWLGGSESLDILWRLGALWPPSIAETGEWWRLLTASFLHLGLVHLFANLAMLAMLGRLVESRFGSPIMLLGYLWCAVGSNALVYALMRMRVLDENLLVGASGAIFGLLGILTAIDVVAWWRTRDSLDLQRLNLLAIVLALQMVVDFSIPNVSFAAHASGFVVGALAGFAIDMVLARRRSGMQPS